MGELEVGRSHHASTQNEAHLTIELQSDVQSHKRLTIEGRATSCGREGNAGLNQSATDAASSGRVCHDEFSECEVAEPQTFDGDAADNPSVEGGKKRVSARRPVVGGRFTHDG